MALERAPVQESMPQPPTCRNAAHGASNCTDCGFERREESLHRLRQDGQVRHFCTSCILHLHKGMYCSLCYRVYEKSTDLGDPSLWLTCSKCQRLTHLECASEHDLPTSSMFFTCIFCSKSETSSSMEMPTTTAASVENGGPPSKKLRFSVNEQEKHTSPDEAVAAARIVAFLAVQEAKDARARARASASFAAKAAARAKAALDSAYRIAQEDARWRAQCSSRFPALVAANSRGLPLPPGQDTSRNGREEGTAFVPVLPSSLSRYKEHTHLKLTTQHHKPKVSQPVFESSRPFASYPDASSQGSTFQKPPRVSVQEGAEQSQTSAESEAAVVSASPASILDAASSLDGPQLNKIATLGSAGVGLHGDGAAAKTGNSSALGPPVTVTSGQSTQPSVSKDQSQVLSKTKVTEDAIPASSGKEILISVDGSDA